MEFPISEMNLELLRQNLPDAWCQIYLYDLHSIEPGWLKEMGVGSMWVKLKGYHRRAKPARIRSKRLISRIWRHNNSQPLAGMAR